MATAFNLTAELNLRGPSNLRQVVGNIRQQLSGLSLNLTIDPRTASNVSTITRNVNDLSRAATSATRNVAALDASLRRLGVGANSTQRTLNSLSTNINTINRNMSSSNRVSRQAANGMEAFGRQAGLAIKRFSAFTVVTAGFYGFSRALSSAYKEFITFNRELVRLQQVTEGSADSLKGLVSEITNVSQKLGVSSSDILSVSVTLAQAGLSANQTKVALEALAKSALAPSFDDLNSTVEGSIALMRQFGIEANQLEGALGSINAVAAKFAVEAGDIIAAIQRTGGVFAAASRGVSEGTDALNEFIAVFTSIRATTRESAETIATGLRTIFSRIQRGDTINALKEYGVNLTDVEGKFVGAYKAVQLLSQGLSKLDPRDLRFSAIVEELGGFRQVGKVIPLIQQFATAQQALGVAQRGSSSLAIDAAIAQEALSVKITKVREEFIALIRDIGQSQSFQRLVDMSLMLASALIKVADAAKDVLPAIAAIGAIRGLGGISNFARGFGRGLRSGNARGFASGGMVPGTGSGDTVPAMLTPGEFVIRKNAVKAIGTDKLHRMNKYANGGEVQKFAQKQATYNSGKVKTEDTIRQGMIGKDSYRFGLVGLRSGTKSKQSRIEKFPISTGKEKNKKTYNVDLYLSSLSESISGRIDKQIEKTIKKDYAHSVKNTAQQLSVATKGSANITQKGMDRALKGNALYSVIGSIFEAALTAIGSPYLEKTEKTKSMDFPFGLGPIAQSFGGMPNNIPTDATRTIGGKGKGMSQMKEQIRRFINATEKDYFTKAEQKRLMKKNAAAGARNIKEGSSIMGSVFSTLPISGTTRARASLAGELSVKAGRGVLNSFFNKWGLSRRDLRKSKDSDNIVGWNKIPTDRQQEFVDDINNIRNRGFYNKGGSVDTVPAMLTPGEFVINKKAASRIGSAQLNQLNRADKIQGFNKGGSVGGVQHMAGGGMVGVFSGLTRVITDLTRRMRLLTMNVPQGGGWVGSGVNPVSTVTNGGISNNRGFQRNARGRFARIASDPISLLLSAGFVGESIGGGAGGALSGFAMNAGIVGTLGQAAGLPPGVNAAVTIITGFIGAIDGYNEAIDKGIIEKNNATIETFSKTLEDSFKQLSNQLNVTVGDLQNVGGIIARLGAAEAENRQAVTRQARGESVGGSINRRIQRIWNAYFGSEGLITRGGNAQFANVNQPQLARDLLTNSKQQAEGINQAIQVGLKQGFSIKEIFKNLQDSGISPEDMKRSVAILQDGLEIATREAKIEAMRQRGELPENIRLEEKVLEQRINALSQEYIKQALAANKTSTAVKDAIIAIDLFNTKLKQIINRISAIDAIRQEDFRQIEIAVGSRMGDAGFAAPSELPVRILENAASFSEDTVISVVNRLANNLGINAETQDRLLNNILAQRELQNQLPSLLGELANAKPEDVGLAQADIQNRIEDILAPFQLPNIDEVLKNIMNKLAENISGDKPLSELANDTSVLQNILESLGSSTDLLISAQKAYDNQLKQTQQSLNKLSDTLSQIDELRINANTIMLEGDINLRRALGMDVPLADMNKPFEESILGLTNIIDPKTGRRRGGTLDPATIAARREQAEREKTNLQLPGNAPRPEDAAAVEAHSQALSRAERNIRNLDKAQQKLANDTTRAANALAKIQELRQLDQKRGEAFFDLASNINDPKWVNEFLQEFDSYQRVMSGGGNLTDLQGAINTFNRRAQVLPEAQRNTEQFRLAEELARIMSAAGGGGITAQQLMQTFFPGGANGITPQIQAAIDAYNEAIQASVDATNYLADTLQNGADIFYAKIMDAAIDFGRWIGDVINGLNNGQPIPPPVRAPQLNAKGGLIYASKGQYVNFQAKGTDTVPAMLTPGEFVVNAKATKKNLGLLKAINSNKTNKVGGYQSGGIAYLENGGLVPDIDTYDVNQLNNLIQFRLDEIAQIQNRMANSKDLLEINQFNKQIIKLNAEMDALSKRKSFLEKTGRKPERTTRQIAQDIEERDQRIAQKTAAYREGRKPPSGYSSWEEYDSTPSKQKEKIAETNREAKDQKRFIELKKIHDINDPNDNPKNTKDYEIWEKYKEKEKQEQRQKDREKTEAEIDLRMKAEAEARQADRDRKRKEDEANKQAQMAANQQAWQNSAEYEKIKAQKEANNKTWEENYQKDKAINDAQKAETDRIEEEKRIVEARKKAAESSDGRWVPQMSDYPAGAKGSIEYSKDLMAAQKVNDENFATKQTERAEQARKNAEIQKEEQRKRDEALRPIQQQKYASTGEGNRTLRDELNDAKAAEESTKSNAVDTYNNQGFFGQIAGGKNNTFTQQASGANHNISRIQELEERLKKATTQQEIDAIRLELRAIKSGSSEQAKQAIQDAESYAGIGTGKEGKWNESNNTTIRAIGNVGGAVQGVEEAAYGGANIVGGAVVGGVAATTYGVGYLAGSDATMAAGAAMGKVATDAITAGAAGVVQGSQALIGQGAIQAGEETILQRNDAQNREIAARGNMGYLTAAAQLIGRTSAGVAAEAGLQAGLARGAGAAAKAATPRKPIAPKPSGARPSGDDLMAAANDFSREMAEKEAARQNARMRTNRQVGTQGGGKSTNVGGEPRQITSQTDVSRGTTGSQLRDPTTGRFTGQKPGGTFEVGRGRTPSQSRNPDTGRFGPRMEGRWESGIERGYNGPGTSSFSTADSLPSGPLQMPGMPSAPPAGIKGKGATTDYTMTVGPQKPVRGTTTTLNQRPQSNIGSGSDSFGPTVGGPGSSNIRTKSDLPRVSRTTDKPITRPTMSQMDTGTRPPVAVTEKDAAKLARGYLDDTMLTAPKPTRTPTKQVASPSATKKGGSTSSTLDDMVGSDKKPQGLRVSQTEWDAMSPFQRRRYIEAKINRKNNRPSSLSGNIVNSVGQSTNIPSTLPKKGGSSTSNSLERPSFAEMIPGLDPVTDAARKQSLIDRMTPGGRTRQRTKDVIDDISFMEPRADTLPTTSGKKGGSSVAEQPVVDRKLGDMTESELTGRDLEASINAQEYFNRKFGNRLRQGVGYGLLSSSTLGGGALYIDTQSKITRAEEEKREINDKALQDRIRRKEAEEQRKKEAKGLYKGGVVYASKGSFVPYSPRGTDTVPAMLTPGEFVVNRKATKENFGLLKAINNGQYLNIGGIVKPKYLEGGGGAGGIPSSSSSGGVSLSIDTGNFDSGVKTFDVSIGNFTNSIGAFSNAINSMVGAVSSIGNLDFSSLNTAFEAINSSASLLSGSAAGFSQVLNQFNSSVTSLQSALGNIRDINLNVTGSIPVDVNVTVNGGDGLSQQLETFKTQIYNDIATQINQKTNGGIKLDIRSN